MEFIVIWPPLIVLNTVVVLIDVLIILFMVVAHVYNTLRNTISLSETAEMSEMI